ncbi:MAG: LysR family transcriptional regulator [Deltaproteobacteria bacterium]|nr:LysR family transcriptional regulator [Nannocystaceae bacterium]
MISPADMILFAAVVREGSFTKAARRLGVTKQTTSERIGKLEERLGVRLLERTTRSVRVTEPGATYYERCAAIATQIDEANAEVQQRQADPVGLLRVSAPVLYGRRFMAPVIADFLGRHPKVRVEVVLADRRIDLIEEGFDLAIRIGKLDDSSLVARRLGEGHVYYVASPEFLAKHGMPRTEHLRSQRCVGVRPFESWEVSGVVSKIEPVLVVNDLEVACDAAVASVGIARLPAIVCREAVEAGQLRVLFGPEPALRRTVYAVYPSRRHLPAKVQLFLDALAALVKPMLPLDPELRPPTAQRRRRPAPASPRAR